MRTVLMILFATMMTARANAEEKIVNAHFSKKSVVVQLQDTETGNTKWISSAEIGVINETLGCSGDNCKASRLRNQDGSLYGDVALYGENEPSLSEVFLIPFYEDRLIDPAVLTLSVIDGEYLISVRTR